jgi:hypothetical protein
VTYGEYMPLQYPGFSFLQLNIRGLGNGFPVTLPMQYEPPLCSLFCLAGDPIPTSFYSNAQSRRYGRVI